MPQPIRKGIKNIHKPRKKETTKKARMKLMREKRKGSQEYGTSKLEERFARDFLDKLGIDYVYQYKMTSIERYLDFFIPDIRVGIEIDGGYWHSDPRLYEEKDLNKMQKYNKKIDEVKNAWCRRNGVPLIRLWEKDINENPEGVLQYLKDTLKPYLDKKKADDNFRHRN